MDLVNAVDAESIAFWRQLNTVILSWFMLIAAHGADDSGRMGLPCVGNRIAANDIGVGMNMESLKIHDHRLSLWYAKREEDVKETVKIQRELSLADVPGWQRCSRRRHKATSNSTVF